MGKIKILSEEVSNRIAAGEVIERPASIVKELVENAIDAEADSITITIDNGGKDLIQVIDNGYGMSEEDAMLAFERHATSKIRTADDIFEINTLGFRGEAIPSIASVSHFTLVTRDKNSELATQVQYNHGTLRDCSKTAANQGTTITVKQLFHLIPARRKFLKSEQVEYKHIVKYLHYQSILYPHITIKLIVNGKEKFHYPAVESIDTRLKAVFGNQFQNENWLSFNKDHPLIALKGFIQSPEDHKKEIEEIRYLFVNGRFIQDKTVISSIRNAYEPYIQKTNIYKSETPQYILFLDMNPLQIDVNVHPAKQEIRFRDTQLVWQFVNQSIAERLKAYEEERFESAKRLVSPSYHFESKNGEVFTPKKEPLNLDSPQSLEQQNTSAPLAHEHQNSKPLHSENLHTPPFQHDASHHTVPQRPIVSPFKDELSQLYQPDLFERKQNKENPNVTPLFIKSEEDIINPWQLHQSYIFIQVEDGLLIIDQHAAHERILYEKLLHRIHGAPAVRQKLLFPLVIDYPPYIDLQIKDFVHEHFESLNRIGFSIKSFSNNTIVIDEIPADLEDWNGSEIFIDILQQIKQEISQLTDYRDIIAKSVACKAAIKAGKKMSRKEMIQLINDLFACEVPYFCPHGRPLMIKMTMQEFDKKFKRIL